METLKVLDRRAGHTPPGSTASDCARVELPIFRASARAFLRDAQLDAEIFIAEVSYLRFLTAVRLTDCRCPSRGRLDKPKRVAPDSNSQQCLSG